MVIYPEGIWYSYRDMDDIDEILTTHVVGGGRVEASCCSPIRPRPRGEAPPPAVAEARARRR